MVRYILDVLALERKKSDREAAWSSGLGRRTCNPEASGSSLSQTAGWGGFSEAPSSTPRLHL